MDELIELVEKPVVRDACLIAGWRQWADAGATSSELPKYLIEQLRARKIGALKSDPFYVFQVPGTHALFRPEVKLEEGYPAELRVKQNEIYFAENNDKPILIFLGDEPQLNAERYADAFFQIAQAFDVRRIVTLGGVYGPVPHDKDRDISCTYSLRKMKDELA
ncbi:MAG: PAC2 family protein, partial [Chloroflexota bacterium]